MNQTKDRPHQVEVFSYDGEGYQPFVSFGDWLVALMNWEARFDPPNVGPLERHNATDEVFVLLRGKGFLFVESDEGLRGYDMQPGVLYNVTQGTYHNVLGTRDAQWLIVESNDTNAENSEYRQMTAGELQALRAQYPGWLR